MEDIRFPAVDEVVLRHSWCIEDLRPWDHDELGWGSNHERWGRRWGCSNVDTNIDLCCHQRWGDQPQGACRQQADKEPSLTHHVPPECGLGTMA